MNNIKMKKWLKAVGLIVGIGLLTALLIWLKILKWILLGIAILFGLLLLLLGLVLFVPLRYYLKAEQNEEQRGWFQASWMLHLLSFKGEYGGKGLRWKVRLAGICVASSEKEKTSRKREDKKKEISREEMPSKQEKGTAAVEKKARKRKKKKTGKGWQQLKEWWSLLRENRGAIRKILCCSLRSLKCVFPRKCNLYLRFGLDDPALTGQIWGAYWAVRPVFMQPGKGKKRFIAEADFHQKVFQLQGWGKGWFSLGSLLWPLLQGLMSTEVRSLYKALKNRKQ